ncbi:hypothetical protein N2152v2_007119 [Parachlorella kessleri]
MPNLKLWVDCDAGVDDAQGVVLALSQPGVDFVGLSAVFGNIGVTQYYGRDGMGDVPAVHPPSPGIKLEPVPGHAAVHLAAAARQAPGELVVVVTGPPTNLALAAKLDPAFPQNVKAVVVMGGADGPGNATADVEYNFYWDPEAAYVLIQKFPRVTLLTWNACLRHQQPWSVLDSWLNRGTPKAQFLAAIMCSSLERERAAPGGAHEGGWVPCDPLAVALALAPERLLLTAELRQCRVELAGGDALRGKTMFGATSAPFAQGNGGAGQGDGLQAPGEGWGAVRLVKEVDMSVFDELMAACLH